MVSHMCGVHCTIFLFSFQQVYYNTSNLIAYMIETNFSSRHDLALLYYPSAVEFYWFVARTYAEIRRKANHEALPHPVSKILTM